MARPMIVVLAAGLVAALAATVGQASSQGVDTGLCPFPISVTASSAAQSDAVAASALKFSFPAPAAYRLRNGATGRTATVRSAGRTIVDTKTGSVAFGGHVLWAWTTGNRVPFLATDGAGTLRAPFYVLSGPARPTVVDPCALVSTPPTMTPRATPGPWALPSYPLSRMAYAGLPPIIGFLVRHDHVHLDLIVDGRRIPVPAGIGLAEPVDNGPCPKPTAPTGDCATGHVFVAVVANSPIHTHTSSGIIHVEPDRKGTYTLGQFFDEWGVRLTSTCLGSYCSGGGKELRAYVDGKRISSPRSIVLGNKQEIALAYGRPGSFGSVPKAYHGGWPGVGCGGAGESSCLP
jgi:hypothetical protein